MEIFKTTREAVSLYATDLYAGVHQYSKKRISEMMELRKQKEQKTQGRILVTCRLRPLPKEENNENENENEESCAVHVLSSSHLLWKTKNINNKAAADFHEFHFSHIWTQDNTQEDMLNNVSTLLQAVVQGKNVI